MARALPAKKMSETITVEFDFSGELEWAETISSQILSVEVLSGVDTAASLLTGASSVSGLIVSQDYTDGLGGVIYLLVCTVTGSTGRVYQLTRRLAVLTDENSFAPGNTLELTGDLPDGGVGDPYSHNLQISGGYAPYEYDAVIAGAAPFWMGFSAVGDQLVCAGIPDELVTTTYTFTVQIMDAANGTASSPQELTIFYLTISGDLPDGLVGDSGVYGYLIQYGTTPYSAVVSAGALPTGATMAASGVVTYTYSAAGYYEWTVTATDAAGRTAFVNDSASITGIFWWATTDNPGFLDKVWTSTDLTNWTQVVRSPQRTTSSYGPVSLGTGVALICGNTGVMERIVDFNPTGGYTTTESSTLPGINLYNVRAYDDIVVAFRYNTPSNYYTTVDDGLTWVEHIPPGTATGFTDIRRMDSGRWIGIVQDGENTRFVYSDQVVPTLWLDATDTAGIASTGGGIATNGSVAAYLGPLGRMARTTDGANWIQQANVPGSPAIAGEDACAIGNMFLIALADSTYIRSTDAGITWAAPVTIGTRISRFSIRDNVIVACYSEAVDSVGTAPDVGAIYSTDLGATFADIPSNPYAVNAGDALRIGPVTYVPLA